MPEYRRRVRRSVRHGIDITGLRSLAWHAMELASQRGVSSPILMEHGSAKELGKVTAHSKDRGDAAKD